MFTLTSSSRSAYIRFSKDADGNCIVDIRGKTLLVPICTKFEEYKGGLRYYVSKDEGNSYYKWLLASGWVRFA